MCDLRFAHFSSCFMTYFYNPLPLRAWWKAPLFLTPLSELTQNGLGLHCGARRCWVSRASLDSVDQRSWGPAPHPCNSLTPELRWGFGRDAEFPFYPQTLYLFEQKLCISYFFANGLFIHWMVIILWVKSWVSELCQKKRCPHICLHFPAPSSSLAVIAILS